MMKSVIEEANLLFDHSSQIRRDLHRYPEVGFKEFRTSGVIASELRNLGYDVTTGIAKTGVIGILNGSKAGRVGMLRFDMDALPITEENHTDYVSLHPGVMHACGHDGHIAVGLTVARILRTYQEEIAGTVKIIFQPAEEMLGGAEMMIAEGVLENPHPDFVLGFHLWNEQPLGWLGITPGAMMACMDSFVVKIIGRGGHGAVPNQAVDPVIASAQIILALQTIVARNVSPFQSAVLSITCIHAGEAANIIPGSVELKGTIRTFQPEARQMILRRFNEIIERIAEGMGCLAEIKVKNDTPPVVNDAKLSGKIKGLAQQMFPEAVIDDNHCLMVSEDMAFYLQKIPGCFVLVGSANAQKNLNASHHNPKFDFDEKALPIAAGFLAASVLDFLGITE